MRYPAIQYIGQTETEDEHLTKELDVSTVQVAANMISHRCSSATTIQDIRDSALDEQYQLLLKKVQYTKFASSQAAEDAMIRPFYNVRNRLFVADGLLMYKFESNPLVIPRSLRRDVLNFLRSLY